MPTVRDAQIRHAAHYSNVLNVADKLYMNGGIGALRGLKMLDVEWANIDGAFTWCADHSGIDRDVDRLSCEFPFAGAYILELRLHPRSYLEWLARGIASARRTGNRQREAAYLTNSALCYVALGHASLAIPMLNDALRLSEEVGDRWGQSVVLDGIGAALSSLGDPHAALKSFERGVEIKLE
jgi:hypothetical protein